MRQSRNQMSNEFLTKLRMVIAEFSKVGQLRTGTTLNTGKAADLVT
ncbi:hypothetical protein ACQY74_004317 [Rhizobium leguminosarum bv. trifolii]